LRRLAASRPTLLFALSFVLPLALWSIVSYVPFVWHPMMRVSDPGDVDTFSRDQLVEKEFFAEENAAAVRAGKRAAQGRASNPVFLPAPHEVARAFVGAFTTPPFRKGEPWLHESLLHSIGTIFWGFALSSLIAVPLGILCGAFAPIAQLTEPFIEFFRYLPAPAFGALAVAVFGIHDAPKISIVFLGTFFPQVLVVANTTRRLDRGLIEAAQTLGASRKQLLTRVIVPGIQVDLFTDTRILLGCAWTYLIVAELVGTMSGITFFINQQAKYRIYENVYAAITMIGLIGLATDRLLARLSRSLFPWAGVPSRDAFAWVLARVLPSRRRRAARVAAELRVTTPAQEVAS
jgi:NitT/TauT family transport system permease protein